MVSTTIYNREEIKTNIAHIFEYIDISDFSMVKHYSDRLLVSLLKYYKTRGISAGHFYDLFDELNYDILNSTQNAFKKRIILDSLETILKEIKSSTKDPIARIKEIYEDIRHLYSNIDAKNVQEIIDCFDEMEELRPEFETIGGPIYNYYTIMMQKVGDCESTILRMPQYSSDSIWNKMEDKFAEFFQAVHKVLSPPIRVMISRGQVYDKIKEGVHPSDIIDATGLGEEELRIMLQEEEMARREGEAS